MSVQAENVQGSVFNVALDCLETLRDALRECNYHSKMSKNSGLHPEHLRLWHDTLTQDVYQEVSPALSKDELKVLNELFRKYNKVGVLMKVSVNPFSNQVQKTVNKAAFVKRWRLNHKIENTLRRYATLHGMLITKKVGEDDEPEYW